MSGDHGGVETEEAVKVEHLPLLDRDGRPHGVVVLLLIGNDDVEAVGGAALEEDDELFVIGGGSGDFGEHTARQKAGDAGRADQSERSAFHKSSTRDAHDRSSVIF